MDAFCSTQSATAHEWSCIAVQAHAVFGELLELALELVRGCDCSGAWGCPACVQHSGCGEYNAVLHKEAAVAILELTLAAQTEFRERVRLQQVAPAQPQPGSSVPLCLLLQCRTRTQQYLVCAAWPGLRVLSAGLTRRSSVNMSLFHAMRRGLGFEAKDACVLHVRVRSGGLAGRMRG